MNEIKCTSCECENEMTQSIFEEISNQDEKSYKEETHFAILLALVPAMTMSLFNLMGLL